MCDEEWMMRLPNRDINNQALLIDRTLFIR